MLGRRIGGQARLYRDVVHSCGAIVHERTLLLPFGIADNFASFASCGVDDLLGRMS
ncbi:hypothetical protein [Sphingomonas sp. MMS24-J13]|uniref:hypothetical protein n=1 Tax=Sphingomonas sp. MMS24-J13 TaxID=3238686 RepID=UPI00384E5FF8